jgi:hypothetical protein
MARTYSHAGWKIFPVWPIAAGVCACPRGAECSSPGKHPLYRPAHDQKDPLRGKCFGACGRVGHGLYDATDDPLINAARWAKHPHAGIGAPAHGNGFVVIDVDPKSGGVESFERLSAYCLRRGVDLDATVAQSTGEHGGIRGTHYLYTAPVDGVKGKPKAFGADMPGLDTRGRGTYIVVAPTPHVSGVAYTWRNWLDDLAPWPTILNPLINPPPVPPPPRPVTTGGGVGYAQEALNREVAKLAATNAVGNRNNTLNIAAFNLGQLVAGGELDRSIVFDLLHSTARGIGLTDEETRRSIESGFRAGERKPRTRPVSVVTG